ncbi:class I SAM-dependent methyltransferase [Lacibacter sp. H375]|uniref:class I SAM-dependent methyltransferase n=1 Tax=Lacibacter sp. H375 TaxID=3133424 RepID=UPI0030C0D15F
MDAYSCCFCKSSHLILKYKDQFHPSNKEIGSYDIYECSNCGSAVTNPVPDTEELKRLYNSFNGGIQSSTAALRKESPLHALYVQLLDHAIRKMKKKIAMDSVFTWVDIGAGNGTLSALIKQRFPNSMGVAIDFHERPALIEHLTGIDWISADFNQEDLTRVLNGRSFDLVITLAVLEHVQDPSIFITKLLPLIEPQGLLFLACPDYSSFARKALKKKWPYFIPGEHINIPSIEGMGLMLEHALSIKSPKQSKKFVKGIWVHYPLRYFFNYFGMRLIGNLLPPSFSLKLPAGALEAGIINDQ